MRLLQGGKGSGNFRHGGRPGEVGGSSSTHWDNEEYKFVDFPGTYFITDKDVEVLKNLTPEEEVCVSKWVDDVSQKNLQSYLRHHLDTSDYLEYYTKQGFENTVTTLDRLIEKSTFDRDVTLYRGAEELPKWMIPGKVFEDTGFVSTTTDEVHVTNSFSGSHGVHFYIKVPKGAHYLPIESWNQYDEKEILLPRNSRYRVLDVDFSAEKYTRVALELLKGN